MRFLITPLLVLALTVMAAGGNRLEAVTSDGEVVFGIIATESAESLHKSWDAFVEAMRQGTGLKIRPFFAQDYAGVIEGMKYNKVDLAWYGNKSAMEAVKHADASIFCQTSEVSGAAGYYSHIIVHRDSPHRSIEDIIAAGDQLVFGNGDPNSTSGFLIPSYYIWALRDIDPRKHFKQVINSNHEANGLAVANKKVDFATNNNKALKRLAKNHPEARQQVRVIWQSPLIPSDPFAWRNGLDYEIKMKLKAWFLSVGRIGPNAEAEREMLAHTSGGFGPFRDSSNHQLLPIRQLSVFKEKVKLQNDEEMDAAEKKKRIADIDAELELLERLTEALEQGY